MNQEKHDLKKAAANFCFDGIYTGGEPYGQGHINDTYALTYQKSDGSSHRYIMQRINHYVFKSPENLMENITGVTNYLRNIIISNAGNPDRETLTLIPTIHEENFYKDPDGNYWRAYIFIENATTHQTVENPNQFYNAGKAFGKFQKLLADYPAHTLHETILNFHNTESRFNDFLKAVNDDTLNRADKVKKEIDFAIDRKEDSSVLINLLKEKKLPLRVTHNDTKLNNVMLDDITGEGVCVIDLDTVMPGLSLYDFGDSIRFGANPAEEDEKDLSKVWMELSLFEAYTKGFMEEAGKSLTKTEIEYLPFASKLMTYECGIRFLADYLSGDVYFKIHREEHNLDRCRTQFKLVSDMELKMDKMKEIVYKYCK